MAKKLFTSESVTEGHPDKICDQISDAVLDAILAEDSMARVACETTVTTGLVHVMGEISTTCYVDIPKLARQVIREIGYDRAKFGFDCDTCAVITSIDEQSPDIAQGVDQKSSTDYRNQNRLVILGFPFEVTAQGVYEKVPVNLPADLLKARPNYYKNNENLLYRDYGPKIFLEIGEGDTLSVPSSNTCPLFNWSSDGAFYFVGGDFSTRGAAPATFPVTLSDDGNTLVIGACNAGEEFMYGTYLPSVYLDNSATPRMEAWGVSDVILERVK